jgi:2-methylisocitrate lyase-like PEP mutase family enzyme
MTQREKADTLRNLHHGPELLVLVNVWDAVSARTVAATPGCHALATASWSIAAAHGERDGENLSREEMIAAVGRVARAVDVPVTADLERGYGDVATTMTAAIEAGAVGCNLEDAMCPTAEHAERVAAAREAGERAGVPLVINARTDVFLAGAGAPEERVDLALERGRAYAEAGGDCIFVPGASDPADLRRLVAEMGAPVSVLAQVGDPPLAELQEIGIARVSVGPGSLAVAMAALRRAASDLLGGGDLPADLAWRG